MDDPAADYETYLTCLERSHYCDRIAELGLLLAEQHCEIKGLRQQLAEAREDWAREFEKRGTEVASVERQKAMLVQGLYQIIDAWDGNDDSMSADPAAIARETLGKALAGGSE